MMRAIAAGTLAALCLLANNGSRAGGAFAQALEALGDYNYPSVVPNLRVAAQEGDVRAQEILGFMLLHGEALQSGLTPDRAEAMQWFARAAANGSDVARQLLRAWAQRGHADAQQALAGMRP